MRNDVELLSFKLNAHRIKCDPECNLQRDFLPGKFMFLSFKFGFT